MSKFRKFREYLGQLDNSELVSIALTITAIFATVWIVISTNPILISIFTVIFIPTFIVYLVLKYIIAVRPNGRD